MFLNLLRIELYGNLSQKTTPVYQLPSTERDRKIIRMNNSTPSEPEPQNETGESPKPWYANGLKFECTGCGNCCSGGPGAVWISDDEIQKIADHLDVSTGEFRLMYTRLLGTRLSLREYANNDCVFFDAENRGCKIYPVRPIQCQTWPFWSSNLASQEAWEKLQPGCPGAGNGNFFSLEQVEEQASRFIL